MRMQKTIPALPVRSIKQACEYYTNSLVSKSGIRKKLLLLQFVTILKFIYGNHATTPGNGEVYYWCLGQLQPVQRVLLPVKPVAELK